MKLTESSASENNDNSPKHSYLSIDSDETICEPYCFVRYRENNVSSDNGYSSMDHALATTPNESDIAKFCQESNYSYSFTNTPMTGSRMRRLSTWMGRNRAERRSMDCLQLIRRNLDMDFGRRYSQPDMGLIARQRSRQHQHQHQRKSQKKPALLSTNGNSSCVNKHYTNWKHGSYQDNNNKTTDSEGFLIGDPPSYASYSSVPTSPVLWDYTSTSTASDTQSPIAEEDEIETRLDPASYIHQATLQQQQQQQQQHRYNDDDTLQWHDKHSTDGSNTVSCANIGDLTRTITQSPVTTTTSSTCASRYLRALHTPTRFLPQQQAILTTDDDGKLLLFNDMACLCLDIDRSFIGRSIFTKLGEPSRRTIAHRLRERKKQLRRKSVLLQRQQLPVDHGGMVLMCGMIVPILKSKNQKSTASLWLKEKWNQVQSRFVYLWIFEEIYESRLTVIVDSQGIIQDTSSTTIESLYGYCRREVIGHSISKIMPSLDIETHSDTELMKKPQFYASRAKDGRYFPSMVHLKQNEIQITSLPTISGLITIHQNGLIQSMNPVPAKYLFGYKSKDIVDGVMPIDSLLPQFMELVTLLDRKHLLRHDRMVTSEECLHILRESSLTSSSSTNAPPTYIVAVHRDGSRFDVELEIRWVESDDENLYSVWITHNRISSSPSSPRTMIPNEPSQPVPRNALSPAHHQQHISPNSCTTGDDMTSSDGTKEFKSDTVCETALQQRQHSPNNDRHEQREEDRYNELSYDRHQHYHQDNQHPFDTEEEQQPLSKFVPSSRFESFGSVPKEKALFPGMQNDSSTTLVPPSSLGSPNVIFPPDFDDYVVTESLGEGAYGAARLAYLKSDPSQEFVIKAIVKSRIIIDSWVRDRKHGSLPMEIHILLKLQQNPHANCPQLVTYIEDDDNYYTVTRLHGNGMDLFDYIELNDHMTEEQVRRIFRQVAAAIQHLHHLRIVHRDIKDENILLDEHGIVQLIDFGSAAYYREGRLFDTFSGTLDYCATEILHGMAYAGPPQDMWSLGVLLYTLIYRETPFYSVDDIMERNLQLPYVPFPEKAVGLVDLLCKLLDRNIDQRPTIDQVMQDPWVQNEG